MDKDYNALSNSLGNEAKEDFFQLSTLLLL